MTISNSSEATTSNSSEAITSSKAAKIVGIGGLPRSGKDSLAELFMKHGFYGVSFGDIIRGYTRERHVEKPDPISVANMTETANWLRNEKGADAVLKKALEMFEAEQNAGNHYDGLVLYSIRAAVEVDFILAHEGDLIWVEATDEVRYQRMLQNLREGEIRIPIEEFIRQENLQAHPQPGLPAEVQMNVTYVKAKATVTFENSQNDLKDFNRRGIELVKQMIA